MYSDILFLYIFVHSTVFSENSFHVKKPLTINKLWFSQSIYSALLPNCSKVMDTSRVLPMGAGEAKFAGFLCNLSANPVKPNIYWSGSPVIRSLCPCLWPPVQRGHDMFLLSLDTGSQWHDPAELRWGDVRLESNIGIRGIRDYDIIS